MNDISYHPLAEMFPLMAGAAFDEFVADVKAHGQRDPIAVFEGKILDGRNRQRACDILGIAADYEELLPNECADPLGFVLSRNLHRRHLDASQRAMVATRLATLKEGRPPREIAQNSAISQTDAASLLNVNRASVQSARKVLDGGTPELIAAVDHGKIAVSVAAALAGLSPAVQARAVAEPARAPTLAKQVVREAREAELAAKQRALPQRRYGVILADPEWRFEPWSRDSGMDRAADNHYPTSELTEIAARDVKSLAADDCVLFLWATAPMLNDALTVMAAWGFEYKSCLVWVKDRIGTGYWVRNAHELLLIGTRGDPPAPAQGAQWASVIRAPVGEHSAKPPIVYEMIEEYFPSLPKTELNARGPRREGWEPWGLEAET